MGATFLSDPYDSAQYAYSTFKFLVHIFYDAHLI